MVVENDMLMTPSLTKSYHRNAQNVQRNVKARDPASKLTLLCRIVDLNNAHGDTVWEYIT